MKKFSGVKAAVAMLLLAGMVAAIAGCGGGESPSSAVRKFFAAVEKDDTKAMEKVTTPEIMQMLTLFGDAGKKEITANGKIKSTTEKIDGDTAVVTVTFENGETDNFDLVKKDGKWKVTINK